MTDRDHISRRELLRGKFLGSLLDTARQSLAPGAEVNKSNESSFASRPTASPARRSSFPVLRPPGAIEEDAFLEGCTRCDACMKACPPRAIIHAPARFREAAGTPMIDPVQQPCVICADFPCIAACEPNVLQMAASKRMGEARIDIFTCLAHTGTFCTVCSEHCPIEQAIEIINNKPRINALHCTGCGVCQHVCPAPENAILLMPLATRGGTSCPTQNPQDPN